MARVAKKEFMCDGKAKYRTAGDAKARVRNSPVKGRLSVYQCPFCLHFHIGHRPRRRRRKR